MIKPIQTRYKGYHFRSRLEARWAVFFDALGVKWEYEKEGYDLGEAGYYLPDFWLPELETWIEVKPDYNTLPEGDADRTHRQLKALRDHSDGTSAILVCGIPGTVQTWAYFNDCSDGGGGFSEAWGGAFCLCDVCGAWFDYYEGVPGSHVAVNAEWGALHVCSCPPMNAPYEFGVAPMDRPVYDWIEACRQRTGDAVQAAKSARFEHGETPG